MAAVPMPADAQGGVHAQGGVPPPEQKPAIAAGMYAAATEAAPAETEGVQTGAPQQPTIPDHWASPRRWTRTIQTCR